VREFKDLSRDAAAAFLQTVVFIDDDAGFVPLSVPATSAEAPPDVVKHHASDDWGADDVDTYQYVRHPLDAGVIGEGFAAAGMVATVLRPQAGGGAVEFDKSVLQVAAKVDVLVLDVVPTDLVDTADGRAPAQSGVGPVVVVRVEPPR
jgi:hypothetical protein